MLNRTQPTLLLIDDDERRSLRAAATLSRRGVSVTVACGVCNADSAESLQAVPRPSARRVQDTSDRVPRALADIELTTPQPSLWPPIPKHLVLGTAIGAARLLDSAPSASPPLVTRVRACRIEPVLDGIDQARRGEAAP